MKRPKKAFEQADDRLKKESTACTATTDLEDVLDQGAAEVKAKGFYS